MEKVFASVRLPLEISVAVARTSQSPFPLTTQILKIITIKILQKISVNSHQIF